MTLAAIRSSSPAHQAAPGRGPRRGAAVEDPDVALHLLRREGGEHPVRRGEHGDRADGQGGEPLGEVRAHHVPGSGEMPAPERAAVRQVQDEGTVGSDEILDLAQASTSAGVDSTVQHRTGLGTGDELLRVEGAPAPHTPPTPSAEATTR